MQKKKRNILPRWGFLLPSLFLVGGFEVREKIKIKN